MRPSARTVLIWLFAAHVLLTLVLFATMAGTPLHGDEAAYADGARALSNLVRDLAALGPVDTAELQRNVVGSGWFMPGSSVLMTPLFVVVPDASAAVIRGYLALVSTGLLLWVVLEVRRALGARYAAALLVVPGLIPMWVMFSMAAWGDLAGGLLVVLLLTRTVVLVRTVRAGVAPSLGQGAALGLIAIAVVYLRSSAALLVVAMLGAGVLAATVSAVRSLSTRERVRASAAVAVAGAVFVGLLLPWSLFASHTLGGRVVTTTSVPTVMANTFGDPNELCFGPCDPGSTIWFTPLRYAREVARATGHSELEVQQQMSAHARADVTRRSYVRDVRGDARRYFLNPTGFVSILSDKPPSDGWGKVITYTSVVPYVLVALGWVLGLLVLVRARYEQQLLSVLIKLGLLALFVQPFVHVGGSRYWTTAAPLGGLALALVVTLVHQQRASPPVVLTRVGLGARWLSATQVVLSLTALAVTVIVLGYAR
ncbi:hypothetical protein [Nocardioides sp.]|uniref:hypothetical protein n=1 Tax=Nocardioides sp. TaxID=35761 RepID=UPI003D14B4FF